MGEHFNKRIGIMTSGGDCAGLNPVIRAVVQRAIGTYGWEVIGIYRATQGLMNRPLEVIHLDEAMVENWLTLGGTMLGTTNKGNPFAFPMPDGTIRDRTADIIEGYHHLGLDALIGVGGDGSLKILREIAQKGNLNLVGIPKTIDNDVAITERSIGFETAVNIATESLDRLHFTASSHDRVMILEVMGRDAGHIALNAGIAGGAHIVLIPEIRYNVQKVCAKIRQRKALGKNYTIVIISEAVCTDTGESLEKIEAFGECRLGGIGQYLAAQISSATGAETRVTVLGHIQRGGIPAPLDRLIATAFGVGAVDLIAEGRYDHIVTWQNRQVVSVPIADAIGHYRAIDPNDTLVKTARGIGICLGD